MIKFLHFPIGVSLEQIIFFLPNFQQRELGLCLTSSQTVGHVTPWMTFFLKFENLSKTFNFHSIFLHFALLDINNLFTTLD